jgi:uncharacterized protein (DUF4415 family)
LSRATRKGHHHTCAGIKDFFCQSPAKERITIRLSREVVERFRESGDGWQTRVDAALREWLKKHSPG